MTDDELLMALESKTQLVRDRVRGVAEGFSTGLLLWGAGGGGKSHTVETALRNLGKPFRLTNSRLTGKGLFDLLQDHPDVLHVIDDAEPLLLDKHAQGVLRSALWGQAGPDGRPHRVVIWQVSNRREEFLFTGGIILIGNSPVPDLPQLKAITTRVPVVNFTPTNEELGAFMRQLANYGHRHGEHKLKPEECLEVVEALLDRTLKLNRNLDLRLYVNGCVDRIQWQAGASENHWLNLLESRLQRRVLHMNECVKTRTGRKEHEIELVKRLTVLPIDERLQEWTRESGKSRAAYYRRLNDLK